jgi:hypothetical protein
MNGSSLFWGPNRKKQIIVAIKIIDTLPRQVPIQQGEASVINYH